MVTILRLALYCLFLGEVVIVDTLLVSQGSTNTYPGLQNTLTLLSLSAHRNGDTKNEHRSTV